MIGVILAAGKGSRLGNFTTDLPKSLLPLNSQGTLLDYNLRILQSLSVEKIYIVTGFNSQKIQEHTTGMKNVACIYNPFWNTCNVLGSLYVALPYLKDDFLFLHADTLVDGSVWQTLKKSAGEIVFPYVKKKCGEEEMKVIVGTNGDLLTVSKQIDHEQAQGEFLGIAKFSRGTVPQLQQASEELFQQGRLDYYMEAAVQRMIDQRRCVVSTLDIGDAPFVEVDFEEDYLFAKKVFHG